MRRPLSVLVLFYTSNRALPKHFPFYGKDLRVPYPLKAQWRSNFSQLTRSLRFLSPRSPPSNSKKYLRTFLRDDPNERSYFETHVNRYVATLQALRREMLLCAYWNSVPPSTTSLPRSSFAKTTKTCVAQISGRAMRRSSPSRRQ